MTRRVAPSVDDPGVAALSGVLGGPGGRFARPRRWAPLLVGVLVAGLVVLVGAGLRAGCEQDGWQADSSRFAPVCFSALPATYVADGGAQDLWPYGSAVGDTAAPREPGSPVVRYDAGPDHALVGLTLVRAGLADLVGPDETTAAARGSQPVEDLYRDDDVRAEASATLSAAAVLVLGALVALVVAVGRWRASRPWDGVLVATAPVVAIAGLVDLSLVGVALAVGGVLAARRSRWLAAGVMLGGALTFAWTAWAVLLAVLVAVVAARRALPDVLALAGSAAGTWLALSLPAVLTGPGVWAAGWAAAFDAPAAPGSVRAVVEAVRGGEVPAYPLVALVVLLVWTAAVGVVVAQRRRSRPVRLEQVCLLVVAVAVGLLGGGPAAALWVLPFAVLALPRVVPLLGWQLVEVAYAATVWWTTDGALVRGETPVEGPLAAMTLLRLVALGSLAALVVRDVAIPSSDPVAEERMPVERQVTTTRSNVVAV
ncbi:hypothetical protein RDV89_07705 [Nocardioides zeae]|uniref:DUF2029 domain-containing protein n=1 Tax=Nocardioides imazamoxiresistens TaxID=3231893 RepID=A0ABU3PUT9_9ACTN|nr:hypothetical protein [Nocardioides zeae]MDT9592949.1 hypothetical protein [Nocardioides zeae]